VTGHGGCVQPLNLHLDGLGLALADLAQADTAAFAVG
jgi:hypothetical protein